MIWHGGEKSGCSLRLLPHFYYVAQHKSFTKAAEALGNNQPNITRCMNNLEQDLGCKLFVRTNHGVSLTPEGQRLYSRAAVAFEQLRLGESEIRADCSLRTGSISIAGQRSRAPSDPSGSPWRVSPAVSGDPPADHQ